MNSTELLHRVCIIHTCRGVIFVFETNLNLNIHGELFSIIPAGISVRHRAREKREIPRDDRKFPAMARTQPDAGR